MLREQGLPVLHSFETENRSGIIMVRCNLAKLLVEELAKKNILVSARGEGLRISVSIYNNENDLVKLVEGLKQLAYLIQ
jgi:selenocysteine lyase/cysteine desulfurase